MDALYHDGQQVKVNLLQKRYGWQYVSANVSLVPEVITT